MTVAHSHPVPLPRPTPAVPPPLESGDRLSRAEFERRYAAMPNTKAELIEGIVYMASPVRLRQHGLQTARLTTWLGYYVAKTPGLSDFADNATLILDDENEPQPDVLMRLPESAGGQSKVSEEDYLEGPIEFVGEVATSSVSIDTHLKFNTYRGHGAQEYLIWRVQDAEVDWFVLRQGQYEPMKVDEKGIFRSGVFPGLWLDVPALLRADLPAMFQTIDAGCATPDHAAFVEKLRSSPK